VSLTENCNRTSSLLRVRTITRTATAPCEVNLIALSARLRRI